MSARKRKETERKNVEPEAPAKDQLITETIEKNYMPYAMSVIISRAIPEIDGFKPSHRKLLYTMFKMGLLNGPRTKSANVVGQTMKLNPHGDMAIYETLVRLTRGNATLLHPFVDSKGSFGKHYSSDMVFAASRYTEVKLDKFCNELFGGIDKNSVDLIDNYDNTLKEPSLLPTSFPNILLTPNTGIAVGMASNICSFNLSELCDATIAVLQNPETTTDTLLDIMKGPDFSDGANIIYDRELMRTVYETGRGKIPLRGVINYVKHGNMLEITEIPYSTSIEQIIKQITELVKSGKMREISDIRDEIDKSGFKLTIDLKKGTDVEKTVARLYKFTSLEDSFDCNFNVLIDSTPKTLGVKALLDEWIKFRINCLRREFTYELEKDREKLHLLEGLASILLDIDKAIKIIRETKQDKDVIGNLMKGFDIDEGQAEFIANIKLRHLNREYIQNRIEEVKSLAEEISNLEETVKSDKKIKKVIIKQLGEIKKKYGTERKTGFVYSDEIDDEPDIINTVEDYKVTVLLTKEGYFKKITEQSLRGNDEQKLKENDYIICTEEASNKNDELIFFSDRMHAYKCRVSDFDDCKASALGDYVPAKVDFEDGEKVLFMKVLNSYAMDEFFTFIFENGKGVRVPVKAYETKGNRKRLTNAYASASPLAGMYYEKEPRNILIVTEQKKGILINSDLISVKTTRSSQGVKLVTLKKNDIVKSVITNPDSSFENPGKYRKIKIPASAVKLDEYDIEKTQISLQLD